MDIVIQNFDTSIKTILVISLNIKNWTVLMTGLCVNLENTIWKFWSPTYESPWPYLDLDSSYTYPDVTLLMWETVEAGGFIWGVYLKTL